VNPVPHAKPSQQGCWFPPQATQDPWLPQRFPAAQVEPAQQVCPGPPQVPQVPAAEQATLAVAQVFPEQQS
jgi:hypothetical protein